MAARGTVPDVNVFRWRHDQVSTRNVAAYRLAAAEVVVRTYDQSERLRIERATAGGHPWRMGDAHQLRLLEIWVVQSCFVVADRVYAKANQGSGADEWLPASVAAWLEELYRLGNAWVPRMEQILAGQQGATPPAVSQGSLPVRLPQAVHTASSGTRTPTDLEVDAAVALLDGVEAQADLAWGEVEWPTGLPGEFRPWIDRMRQRYTGMKSVAEQQRNLWLGRPEGSLRHELHGRVLTLAEDYFRLGQSVLIPRLFDPSFVVRADRITVAGSGRSAADRMLEALRHWLGFDPWLLTARERRTNPTVETVSQLDQFWRDDPDPQATRVVHERLAAAFAAGLLERRGDETLRECPWSPVYVANATINVGERIGQGTIFVFQPGLVGGVFTHQFRRLGSDPKRTPAPKTRVPPPPRPASPAPGAASPAPRPASRVSSTDPDRPELWIMTDPEVRQQKADDPAVRRQLAALWAADDNRARTRALCDQVGAALAEGKIRRRPRKAWWSCPWPSTFIALRRVGIGGENIRPGEVFGVIAELVDGRFARRIIRIGRLATVPGE